jgi:hypothetical protein
MKLSSVRLGRPWRASAAGLVFATAIGAAPAFAQLEWNQHSLTAPNGTLFGASAAIEDNVALVGAPFDATYGLGAGAAHLYDGRLEWREVKTLFASDARRAKRFGEAVAVTADLAFVGAPGVDPSSGEVYVFDRNAGARNGWGEVARIENLGPWPFARFGAALAVWQDVLVIGAPGAADDMGRAYVLRRGRESSQWRLIRVLEPEHQGAARFGASVAVSAEWIAIGAPGATGEGLLLTGATYLYERDRGGHDGWMLAAKFAPEDGVAGQRYGSCVALGPATLAVGAPCDPDGGSDSGAAYVYERDTDGLWPLQRKLYALDATPTASFGASLSIAGDELLVGARNAGPFGVGQAYLFERGHAVPGRWMECECLEATTPARGAIAGFGASVALAPGRRLVGAPGVPALGGAALAQLFTSEPQISSYCVPAGGSPRCRGVLSSLGAPSASLSTEFQIRAHGIDASRLGMLFYSVDSRNDVPWGSALTPLCIRSPLQRCGLTHSSGTPGRCDGLMELDWNAFAGGRSGMLGQPFFAGQKISVQAICRDPLTSKHSALSNALEFTLGP